ncbi:hypothetical protein NDU88_002808 [Pleurodeles waltl]|uniref:Uncharacterized protein n=1 Tax=Pleurodeles waltl TaxID=8319 RepID=A0AAV7NJN3_PLEWA|nr:hypothetical protein NDU88_002808 [Pleurodeles waltl]
MLNLLLRKIISQVSSLLPPDRVVSSLHNICRRKAGHGERQRRRQAESVSIARKAAGATSLSITISKTETTGIHCNITLHKRITAAAHRPDPASRAAWREEQSKGVCTELAVTAPSISEQPTNNLMTPKQAKENRLRIH